jgi:hypothetical protein
MDLRRITSCRDRVKGAVRIRINQDNLGRRMNADGRALKWQGELKIVLGAVWEGGGGY